MSGGRSFLPSAADRLLAIVPGRLTAQPAAEARPAGPADQRHRPPNEPETASSRAARPTVVVPDPTNDSHNQLWDDAYAELRKKDKKLVEEYEKIVLEEYQRMTKGQPKGMAQQADRCLGSWLTKS